MIIHRSNEESGFELLEESQRVLISALTVAAIYMPEVKPCPKGKDDKPVCAGELWVNREDAMLTAEKIRLTLRMAATHGHTRLVLGALGCGAFKNPKERVAELFKSVLLEEEFKGGRWEYVYFAVWCPPEKYPRPAGQGTSLFDIFYRILDGVVV